jgi:hypothetical protein
VYSRAYGARSPPACEELEVRNVHRGLHNYVIPWIRAPLEKLIFPQLVKNSPNFIELEGSLPVFTKVHHLSLPWARSIHYTPSSCFLKIHFILSLLSTVKSSKCLFPSGFSPKPWIYLSSPHNCHLILLGLAIRIIFGGIYRPWSCSLCMQSLPVPFSSARTSSLAPYSQTPPPSPRERPSLKQISKNRQNYSSVYFNLCIFDSKSKKTIPDRMFAGNKRVQIALNFFTKSVVLLGLFPDFWWVKIVMHVHGVSK